MRPYPLYLSIALVFCLSVNNLRAGDFIKVETTNLTSDIKDGVAKITLLQPENTDLNSIKWSKQDVALGSLEGNGLEEGKVYTITLNDNSGKEYSETFEIPANSGQEKVNAAFTPFVNGLAWALFSDPFAAVGMYDPVIYGDDGQPMKHPNGDIQMMSVPIVVLWLVFGALFFTLRMGFINLRGFGHSIQLARGKYDDPNDAGEVSHFQALATALSGTVGLGNIAGVATAMVVGGPGATFWMIVAGLLGMSSKFVECTLGVKYRRINAEGEVSGGPMYYLSRGLEKKGLKGLGKVLAALFAVLCVGGSIGGGNMYQANQSFSQLSNMVPELADKGILVGIVLAFFTGLVILGGIKSIAKVTDKIVPLMVGVYVLAALVIIGKHLDFVGEAFSLIIDGAFSPDAAKGGFIGVLIMGFRRAAFSNEAGVGSASIAHSASKTDHPVSEGMVSLLEPFIDTVVICTMTALVLIFTGFATDPSGLDGAALTSAAFKSQFSWFDIVLTVAILLFAFSTMISWSYYGMKSWTYLVGENKRSQLAYKIFFLLMTIVGTSSGKGAVMDFSDMMILGMAIPNIIGLLILSGEVKTDLKHYLADLKSGVIKKFK